MVGIFSRLGSRRWHRRAQSEIDARESSPLPHSSEVEGSSPSVVFHGIETELDIKLKPVEHPIEPLEQDQPVKCPLPDPSIFNDGRLLSNQLSSASGSQKIDTSSAQSEGHSEPEAAGAKSPPSQGKICHITCA